MQEYNRFELENELKRHMYRLIPSCVLASNSVRRKELLQNLGIEVFTLPVDAKEFTPRLGNPAEIVKKNAFLKMDRLKETHDIKNIVYPIITADTVVAVDLERVNSLVNNNQIYSAYNCYILGKPKDKTEALNMLSLLRKAKVHRVYTGIAVSFYDRADRRDFTVYADDYADVVFKDGVSKEDLIRYIQDPNVLSAAGSYRIQNNPDALFSSVYGDITTVEGLSYTALYEALERIDFASR